MLKKLNIAVLISTAKHPISGAPIASTSDKAAFELACKLVPESALTILCAESASEIELNDYFGLGARTIEVVRVDEGADIVPALQNRLQGFDLILCGVRSDGQFSSGLLPYLLAQALQLPLLNDVLEAKLEDAVLQARQFLPKGLRRRLEVMLPAIVSVHPAAPQIRQFAYARARAGRVIYSTTEKTENTQDSENSATTSWRIELATRRPQPLKAKINQCGHSRMLGAIGGEADSKNRLVLKEGSAAQKAVKLLSWLRERRLVDL